MNTISTSPSKKEVLRYISEDSLIQKIKDSQLLLLDGEYEDEYCNSLFDLFIEHHAEADISDWEEFTKQILHNAPKEAREELKYISFDWIEEETDNDYDIYQDTRELTINDSFLMRGY